MQSNAKSTISAAAARPKVTTMRVLAVDPGYEKVGIAVLEEVKGNPILLHSFCFTTNSKLPHPERLKLIAEELLKNIRIFRPVRLAIETVLFNTNQKTASLVSEARGVIICEAARKGIPVSQYTPLEVKVATTGYGRGSKDHVKRMVDKLVSLEKRNGTQRARGDDEYDAIAVGLTCLATIRRSMFNHSLG